MHCGENFFAHNVYFDSDVVHFFGEVSAKFIYCDVRLLQAHHHHHNEVARQNGLSDVRNIHLMFREVVAHPRDNSDLVISDHCNNCIHTKDITAFLLYVSSANCRKRKQEILER